MDGSGAVPGVLNLHILVDWATLFIQWGKCDVPALKKDG
jgi:hypothetical protein